MNNINFGHSSRISYDEACYRDKIYESTGALSYKLDTNNIYNCQECMSSLGPRTSRNGNSVSTSIGFPPATSQHLVDIDSILSNRNVKLSKAKTGKLNDIDVTKFSLVNMPLCNKFLDPTASRLTDPTQNYRDIPINRFYDLDRNIQEAVFWDFATNSRLESTDNFFEEPTIPWQEKSLPKYIKGKINNVYKIPRGAYCNEGSYIE